MNRHSNLLQHKIVENCIERVVYKMRITYIASNNHYSVHICRYVGNNIKVKYGMEILCILPFALWFVKHLCFFSSNIVM